MDKNKKQEVVHSDYHIDNYNRGSVREMQLQKIKKIQMTFEEVSPFNLTEMVNYFERGDSIDSNIDKWLKIANAYEKYLDSRHGNLSLEFKQEVFTFLLSKFIMPDNDILKNTRLTLLTDQTAQEILRFYTDDLDYADDLAYTDDLAYADDNDSKPLGFLEIGRMLIIGLFLLFIVAIFVVGTGSDKTYDG